MLRKQYFVDFIAINFSKNFFPIVRKQNLLFFQRTIFFCLKEIAEIFIPSIQYCAADRV